MTRGSVFRSPWTGAGIASTAPRPRSRRTFAPWLAALLAFAAGAVRAAAPADGEPQRDVVFTEYSPLATGGELARRLLSPLTYAQVHANAARLRERPVDLADERFFVRVPKGPVPEHGYALLVFIPPWPQAAVPAEWAGALDRYGIAVVSAANSGNEADVLGRRIPLALLAYANMHARYPLDPQRIYIGGFSGGARVALRIALGYADVFTGALLDAGGDPIGTHDVPLPPADLLPPFQEAMRIVYITGEQDEGNVHAALISRRSLTESCAFDNETATVPRLGHEALTAPAFARALKLIERHERADPERLAACRARLDTAMAADFAEAEAALRSDDRAKAHELVAAIDARYGGLAAARVLAFVERIDRH